MKRQRIFLVVLFFLFSVMASVDLLAQEENVLPSLKFKDADIRVVLQAITQKAIAKGSINLTAGK